MSDIEQFTVHHLQFEVEAQMLLVRSVTKVNEALLGNSAVQFVATATIGAASSAR